MGPLTEISVAVHAQAAAAAAGANQPSMNDPPSADVDPNEN